MTLLLSRALRRLGRTRAWALPALIISFVFLTSWPLMVLAEPASNTITAPENYWWYFVVTAATVGYGDHFPVSATGQVAGGANLICFTTGRGSAYGCAPSPSLKLSTNTALWLKQEDDIDINCGDVVDGTASIDEMGERIFRLMLDTASGRKTKSEVHGYAQNEFVPWALGAVM